jgi:hypothetical protein
MTIVDESTRFNSTAQTYNSYSNEPGLELHDRTDERSSALRKESQKRVSMFRNLSTRWIPSDQETNMEGSRSWERRLFLLLTEPELSVGSAVFYFILIFAIFVSNVIMIMQTMDSWQFIPTDCRSCGGCVR